MRDGFPGLVALLTLNMALLAPLLAFAEVPATLFAADLVVVVALLLLGGPRLGPLVAAVAWSVLFVYQLTSASSRLMIAEEVLLFDLLHLLRHLLVLLGDLYGPPALLVALSSAFGVVAVTGCMAWLGLKLVRDVPVLQRPAILLVAGLVAVVGAALPDLHLTQWVGQRLASNAVASVQQWRRLSSLTRTDRHRDLLDRTPRRTPDIHVYVVEAYGAVSFRSPELAPVTVHDLTVIGDALRGDGWQFASGYGTSPVSGGRSWLADATLLLGFPVRHEATFRYLSDRLDRFTHLPALLGHHGYRTVEVRPNHRARAGFRLTNDLSWDRNVTFDTLDYTGPTVGWGLVPDEYTLGWVRDVGVAEAAGQPAFVFAHLVSSHVPWETPPPLLGDWRDWADAAPADLETPAYEKEARGVWELRWQARRFKRTAEQLIRIATAKERGDALVRYQRVIRYEMAALRNHLVAFEPPRPVVILVLGDHQPAWIAGTEDYDVPIHVVATDAALLAPFVGRGFVPGMLPGEADPLPLADLLAVLSELLMGSGP